MPVPPVDVSRRALLEDLIVDRLLALTARDHESSPRRDSDQETPGAESAVHRRFESRFQRYRFDVARNPGAVPQAVYDGAPLALKFLGS
jgi:hypothetical protein